MRHELFKYQEYILGKSLNSLNRTYILLGKYIEVSNTAEYNTINIGLTSQASYIAAMNINQQNINQQTRLFSQRTHHMCLPELNHCLLSRHCREKFTFYSIL